MWHSVNIWVGHYWLSPSCILAVKDSSWDSAISLVHWPSSPALENHLVLEDPFRSLSQHRWRPETSFSASPGWEARPPCPPKLLDPKFLDRYSAAVGLQYQAGSRERSFLLPCTHAASENIQEALDLHRPLLAGEALGPRCSLAPSCRGSSMWTGNAQTGASPVPARRRLQECS